MALIKKMHLGNVNTSFKSFCHTLPHWLQLLTMFAPRRVDVDQPVSAAGNACIKVLVRKDLNFGGDCSCACREAKCQACAEGEKDAVR